MFKDDGIKFQWGKKYIRSEKVIPNVGGKYWKWNTDHSITQFSPPELRFRIFYDGLKNEIKNFTNIGNTFTMESIQDLDKIKQFIELDFWKYRGIFVKEIKDLTITIDIDQHVLESTYFPSVGPED